MSVVQVRERVREAHRKSVEYDIADVARYLQETLGASLVAHIAGVSSPKVVASWVSERHAPRPEAEERLRAAFQVFHMLQQEDSPHTVRAWLVGMNPQLDDEAPATALREGRFRDVVVAAKAFLAGG